MSTNEKPEEDFTDAIGRSIVYAAISPGLVLFSYLAFYWQRDTAILAFGVLAYLLSIPAGLIWAVYVGRCLRRYGAKALWLLLATPVAFWGVVALNQLLRDCAEYGCILP